MPSHFNSDSAPQSSEIILELLKELSLHKVLLTGMAGFIGAEVGAQLLEAGIAVVGVDNFNDYYDPALKRHRLESLRSKHNFEFVQADIENSEALDALFKKHKFDAVFNLAARAGVGPSVAQPHVYYQTNVTGTIHLLEAMARHCVGKMILASTSSVYSGEELPFHEEAPVNRPISPYAASKKAAEQIAHSFHHHFGVSCIVLRYFTVFGPAGRPDMSPFRFMRWIDEGAPVQVFGDGHQSRDFTFVEDVARGTIAAARLNGYEIINLGGGREPVSINRLIEGIEHGLGKKARIETKPALKADIRETRANIEKAKRLLGWEPNTSFHTGLERTLQWYSLNREFVRRLRL